MLLAAILFIAAQALLTQIQCGASVALIEGLYNTGD